VQGGAKVIVCNRTAARTASFQGRAGIAATPAELADNADVVFACLTTADSYREVLLGPDGVIRGGRAKTYVHVGTNEVAVLQELAAALAGRGIATLDAPMTGGVPRAINGTLTVMASGPRDVFERTEPFFKLYANKIVYLSDRVGAAQVMKFVNNILSASNLALACEAMVLGRKSGLDPAAMLEVLNNGSGQNTATAYENSGPGADAKIQSWRRHRADDQGFGGVQRRGAAARRAGAARRSGHRIVSDRCGRGG